MPLYIVYEITGTQAPVATTDHSEAKAYMAELLDDCWKAECIARDSDGTIDKITPEMTDAAASKWLTDDRDDDDIPGWARSTDAYDDWRSRVAWLDRNAQADRVNEYALMANL